MKNLTRYLVFSSLFVITAIVLSGVQVSLWMQLFGWFPAPQLWLTVLAFWAIHRSLGESIAMTYALAIVAGSFTTSPVSYLLFMSLAALTAILIVKRRVYWGGLTFFMLAVAVGTGAFYVSGWIVAWLKEPTLSHPLPILQWLISVLLTTLFSLPVYGFYGFLNRLLDREVVGGLMRRWQGE